MNNLFSVMNN